MTLTHCSDLSPASWIADSDRSWEELAEFGPPGFPAYARLRFLPDPTHDGQSENDVDLDGDAPSESAQLRAVLALLAGHTRTPGDCYFCLWDGWGWSVDGGGAWISDLPTPATRPDLLRTSAPDPAGVPGLVDRSGDPPSAPLAPRLVIPHRAYFLFRGAVSELGDWGGAQTPPGRAPRTMPDPAFIWPADHAWCVANDVDPHWAGIGADAAAIGQLLADPLLDVVPAEPGEVQPRYR